MSKKVNGLEVDGHTKNPSHKRSGSRDSKCCSPYWSKLYVTPFDLTISGGWFGHLLTTWTLIELVLNVLQISKYEGPGYPLTMWMSFMFSLITSFVVLVGLGFLGLLTNSSANDFYDLRINDASISYRSLRKLLRARLNIAQDFTYFVRTFLWNLVDLALIVVLIYDVNNYDGNVWASRGVIKNVPIVLIYYLFAIVRGLFQLSQAFDRRVLVPVTRDQIMKLDHDTTNEDDDVSAEKKALIGITDKNAVEMNSVL